MNFELAFYLVLAFITGRLSTLTIYIGPDPKKYKEADFAILLSRK